MLLAGDAAGFIDPMTGDGLRLALAGSDLAVTEVLRTLETGDFAGAVFRLAAGRRRVLGRKLRFNRAMRQLSGSSAALAAAAWGSRLAPGLVQRAIRFAGDLG
jgi:flavin-dependent dehydrogenase